MTISSSVPTCTHAPLSHRLEVRHIGSSAVVTPTTTPNGHQKQDALLTQHGHSAPVNPPGRATMRVPAHWASATGTEKL